MIETQHRAHTIVINLQMFGIVLNLNKYLYETY